MTTRKKIFVGRITLTGKREIFRLSHLEYASFGVFPSYIYIKYTFTLGPFKTVRAAQLCVEDDDCSSVSVAKTYEKRILHNKSQTELINSYKNNLSK